MLVTVSLVLKIGGFLVKCYSSLAVSGFSRNEFNPQVTNVIYIWSTHS